MKLKTVIGILVAIGLVAFVFAMIGRPDTKKQSEAKAQKETLSDTTVPVKFAQPVLRDIQETLEVSGALRSLSEVEVGAKIAGRLTTVLVNDGSPVRRGQLLAQVETQELYEKLTQAMASVDVAESARQQAELQSRISPQQSQANIRQAKAGLSAAESRLRLLREGARKEDRNQAKERVYEAKAKLDKAKADLDRAKRLYEGDAISKAEVDAAQLSYETALSGYRTALEAQNAIIEGARPEEIRQAQDAVQQAQEQLTLAITNSSNDFLRKQQLQQAEANLRQARANVRLAQLQIADSAIVAPVEGYVSGVPAQVGQVVNPGTKIATVVGTRDLYFSGQVPEKEVSKISVGLAVQVRMDAFRDKTFTGRVVAIDPRADALGRLFSARISLLDPSRVLKPGMFGKATITQSTIKNATTVPTAAIVREDGKTFVFVAQGTKAKKQEVRVGATDDGHIQVFGIATNDKVVVDGKELLTDGATIREDKPVAKK